ncbi:NnrS family protein [Paucibacter soli]|uniref:NnrS family protein n=1 Tax=Paucibacter soli TaxID=3133433 RepID=UPI0030B35E9E
MLNPHQAPHRAWFLAGALAWLSLAAWWSGVGQASAQHGLLFTLGFLPFFIAGFALTALPKWLGAAALPATAWLGPLVLLMLGWGLHAALDAPGLGLAAIGWTWLLLRLAPLLRASTKPDRRHAQGVLLGMAVLGLALWCAALGWPAQATRLALWGGLGTVFACALQRLTPFLHAEGRRADGLLLALLLGLWLRGLAPVLGLADWLPGLGYLALAAMLARAAFNPALAAARRTPFVGQLHHGLLWLIASFVLAALRFELASVHALTLGFMCSTMLAMVSRVTAVQQGISVVVDLPLRLMHGLLQLLSALRVASACWPQAPRWWLPAAAAGFALLAAAWLLRYGPWLLRPAQRRERRTSP